MPSNEERYARFILDMLRGAPPGGGLERSDWSGLTRLALRHAVLARVSERLAAFGVTGSPGFAAAADRERERGRGAVEVLQHIQAACARHSIAWMVPKAVQHYPDVGPGLDLLVFAPGDVIDRFVLEGLAVVREHSTLLNRVAGNTVYTVVGAEAPGLVLDVYHDRIGSAGQHAAFTRVLAGNARRAMLDGAEVCVPSPEDQLVLQGLENVVGCRWFCLSDVLQTVTLLRTPRLDWEYVAATARAQGGWGGLSCYLHYVDEAHTHLVGRPILTVEQRRHLALRGWGHTRLDEAGFCVPAVRVTGRVHSRQLGAALARADWNTALRLSMWPFALVGSRLGRLRRNEPARSGGDAVTDMSTPLADADRAR